jgi:hypothetical protein
MQPDRELRDLVRELARLRRRGATRHPAKLRARITAWVIARRERGEWWTEIVSAIGIPAQTLIRWCETGRAATAEMKAVSVIDTPPVGTVTLVSPTGLRIEGISIDTAIAILRGIA